MSKGGYIGGSTIVGYGTTRTKRRSGFKGLSGVGPENEQRKLHQARTEAKIAKRISDTEKMIRKIYGTKALEHARDVRISKESARKEAILKAKQEHKQARLAFASVEQALSREPTAKSALARALHKALSERKLT